MTSSITSPYGAMKNDDLVLLAAKFFGHRAEVSAAFQSGDGGSSVLGASKSYSTSWKFKEMAGLSTTDDAVAMMREMQRSKDWTDRISAAEANKTAATQATIQTSNSPAGVPSGQTTDEDKASNRPRG